jgi:hypothetical protein
VYCENEFAGLPGFTSVTFNPTLLPAVDRSGSVAYRFDSAFSQNFVQLGGQHFTMKIVNYDMCSMGVLILQVVMD